MDLGSVQERLKAIKPNKNLHGPEWALAEDISRAFGEPKRFAMYLGTIRRVGTQRALFIFKNIQDGNAKNPRALFFFLCKKPVDSVTKYE